MVDSRETFQKLAAFAEHYMPRVRDRIEHYTGERPLFELYDVEAEIEQRAVARAWRSSRAATLVIDQTEALTTIDVNTGGFVGGRSLDDTIFKTNLEAAQAIARQLRLRNLGGIIVVDFIDMAGRGAPRRRCSRSCKRALVARPHAHDGERLHRARPGRDDAQAHARVARARAVRALPRLRRPRRGQDRAHRLLRDPARDPARGARLPRRRSSACSPRRR
mgnify:CR=1 FL=1